MPPFCGGQCSKITALPRVRKRRRRSELQQAPGRNRLTHMRAISHVLAIRPVSYTISEHNGNILTLHSKCGRSSASEATKPGSIYSACSSWAIRRSRVAGLRGARCRAIRGGALRGLLSSCDGHSSGDRGSTRGPLGSITRGSEIFSGFVVTDGRTAPIIRLVADANVDRFFASGAVLRIIDAVECNGIVLFQ